ncbi:MAG: DMT family transporter [Candidatus Wallbacteria bacterium]|nr:DMT family transporter [Candidatus Wallbacteria bacterium]
MIEPIEIMQTVPVRSRSVPPRWLLIGIAVLINMIWALSYPISKDMIASLNPLALSCWRIVLAAAVLLPFIRRQEIPDRITSRDVYLMLIMGLLGCGAAIMLQYAGTERTTASNVSMLVGLETPMVVLLSAVFLAERLSIRSVLSLVLAFLGVVLLTVDPATLDLLGSRNLAGNLMVLASIFCVSSYTITGKLLVGRWGATASTALPFLVAALTFVPAFAWYDPVAWHRGLCLNGREWLGVIFLSVIVTGIGYLAWNWLLKFMSAGELSFYLYLQPLAGAGFSVWLLGEKLTGTFFIGAVLILGAIVLGNRTATHQTPVSAAENKKRICP